MGSQIHTRAPEGAVHAFIPIGGTGGSGLWVQWTDDVMNMILNDRQSRALWEKELGGIFIDAMDNFRRSEAGQ